VVAEGGHLVRRDQGVIPTVFNGDFSQGGWSGYEWQVECPSCADLWDFRVGHSNADIKPRPGDSSKLAAYLTNPRIDDLWDIFIEHSPVFIPPGRTKLQFKYVVEKRDRKDELAVQLGDDQIASIGIGSVTTGVERTFTKDISQYAGQARSIKITLRDPGLLSVVGSKVYIYDITLLTKDLVLEDLSVATSTVPPGSQADISYNVANRGTDTVTETYRENIYLSLDETLDAADSLLLQTVGHGADLPAGATAQFRQRVTIPPSTLPGQYFILVKTDAGGSVSEVNESNNTAAIAIKVETGGTTWSISPAAASVNEGAGSVTFTVSRSASTTAQTVYVSTTQTEGFTNSNDYVGLVSQALAFAVGESSKTVPVTIINDTVVEPNETFGFIVQQNASDPIGTYLAKARFTIVNND
jgi:hypothetical protein